MKSEKIKVLKLLLENPVYIIVWIFFTNVYIIIFLIELRKTFKSFDKDRNGYIEAHELKNALKMLGENPTETEVLEMIKGADTVCK